MEDFAPLMPTEVVFPVGGTPSAMCSSVDIVDDTALEGDHDFTVGIMGISSDPPHATIADPSSTSINITDNDGK